MYGAGPFMSRPDTTSQRDLRAPPSPAGAAHNDTSLSIDRLSVARGGRVILHDVSLRIEARTITAIVGASGAGKSSLLRALTGLLPLSSGRISLAGVGPLEDRSLLQRARRQIGIIFQEHALLERL